MKHSDDCSQTRRSTTVPDNPELEQSTFSKWVTEFRTRWWFFANNNNLWALLAMFAIGMLVGLRVS